MMTNNESQESEKNMDSYYREMYEREQKKNEELTRTIVALEAQNADLNYKLDKVRKSRLWRAIYPARLLWSHIRNIFTRIRSYGNIKNILIKLKSKQIERKAYKSYGTLSFPAEEEEKKQRETKFNKEVKFSILVPLYNTPEKFLREMIESVLKQTYGNFELCLADGSDNEHGDVGQICKEY
ncbi:MAG: glycosyltransferase, partial [Lachnospiraceae bacterium]|nr:glycosyltransferase [Lachnospiraceae bacterium]